MSWSAGQVPRRSRTSFIRNKVAPYCQVVIRTHSVSQCIPALPSCQWFRQVALLQEHAIVKMYQSGIVRTEGHGQSSPCTLSCRWGRTGNCRGTVAPPCTRGSMYDRRSHQQTRQTVMVAVSALI
ncbi:hypothetical protein RRG08_045543 [Elysia crispata]|uniref:Uncharacterized protein n=1 Tax=Elysia crispata TaxID=231223 RepID=A0AAE1DGD1_9GAST|nr:hypothetical protein RRG08_045543 [Elysia crispata]